MRNRTKKLRLIQLGLIIFGSVIIFYTYFEKEQPLSQKILTKETQKKINNQLSDQAESGDVFYNIEYSGLDLEGNRYILRSKEAYSNKKINQEIIRMKTVEAFFYFKDDTILNVKSNLGTYNNKTLDMVFSGDVVGKYGGSKLFAKKAEYSNSKGFLSISENVKIKDIRGTMVADKLVFDIKKETLNIASFKNNKINADINLK
jgi:lipopolysaccharide export system protein LptA